MWNIVPVFNSPQARLRIVNSTNVTLLKEKVASVTVFHHLDLTMLPEEGKYQGLVIVDDAVSARSCIFLNIYMQLLLIV